MSVSWASVDIATPEMGETSAGVGSCNMFAFLKVDGPLQL